MITARQQIETFRRLHESGCFVIPNPWDQGTARVLEQLGFPALATTSAGVAGFSVEDATRSGAEPLYDFTLAVERVAAAVEEAQRADAPPVVTARTEGFIVGRPDLDETVKRLTAFAEAGADCLYAPGIRSDEEIATVVKAVAPRPVNVLVGSDFTTVAKLAALGVRRISVGGALARVAWGAFLTAAEEIAREGSFVGLRKGVPFAALDDRLRTEGEP